MEIAYYLISDGTIDSNITDALVVEATESAEECIARAIEAFIAITGRPRDEIVVNPVGRRCG